MTLPKPHPGLLLADHLLSVPDQLSVAAGVSGDCPEPVSDPILYGGPDPVSGQLMLVAGKQTILVEM